MLDPALLDPAASARRTFLYRSLRELDAALGGALLVLRGDPVDVVSRVAAAVDAATVHVAADFGPYGSRREIHPRTLLADLASRRSASAETYRTELAWRDFYADIVFRRPDSARGKYDKAFDPLPVADGAAARAAFDAWREGCTGLPIVDAGMRQLRQQAWMHNRFG